MDRRVGQEVHDRLLAVGRVHYRLIRASQLGPCRLSRPDPDQYAGLPDLAMLWQKPATDDDWRPIP
jgi:hypothetical protein